MMRQARSGATSRSLSPTLTCRNAAKGLAYLELAFPVEASVRKSVSLLTADNNANPPTPSQADELLISLLRDCCVLQKPHATVSTPSHWACH
eukprot:6206832-Pleurochrysis_carterae.AAC.3